MTSRQKNEKLIFWYAVVLIVCTLLALAAMLYILHSSAGQAAELDQMEGDREACVTAIGDFSDGSDYLTNEVWAYATNGDISHLRNYWNEVENTRSRDKALQELLHMDLTEQEKTHVLRAKAYSDTLIAGETWSMRLLAESYGVPESQMPARVRALKLQSSEGALAPDAKREKAQAYLFGSEYAESKKNIRNMVGAFTTDLSARLANATAETLAVNQRSGRWAVAAITLLMLLILVLIYGYSRIVRLKNRALVHALEDAEAASSAKSYFTSRMSHEIRTPLNAVLGYLHIAQTADSGSQRDDAIEKSRVAANNLLGIVNDVLDLSAIESGRMQLSSEPYRVSSLLKDARIVYAGLAENRRLTLEIPEPELISDTLAGDRMRVGQLLTNLLSNAVKFTPAGGRVVLCVRQQQAGDTLETVYTVRDTGIGMSPEFLPHIFDAYEQEDASIHGRFGGTGLGMSIVKSLVDKMGGSIEVESEKGKGSVFTLTLCDPPAELPAGQTLSDGAPQRAFREAGSLSGLRILLVEDNEMNIELAGFLLRRAGAAVTEAHNGREAVDAYCRAPEGAFSAVLMDIIMPEMDGYEATRRIRASGRADAGTLPIIAMSANAFTSDVRQALDAGMNAHTAKPIDMERLVETIRRFCPDMGSSV